MKSSSSENSQVSILKEYLHTANQWFSQTPERALEQAYQAALKIKSLEDEYFDGGEISAASAKENDYIMPVVQADLAKFLRIAKLRLAEFQVSYSVLGSLIPNYLEKLKFIDNVLGKYTEQKNSLSLLPLSLEGKNSPSKANSSLKEDDLEVTGLYNPKLKVHAAKPESQTQPLNPHSVRGLVTNVGLASTLLAGGFAAGAVCSGMLLSPQNAAANDDKHPHLVEVHPDDAPAQTNSTHTTASVSAPEIMPPEPSVAAGTPTQLPKQEAASHLSPASVHPSSQTVEASRIHPPASPHKPESIPPESSVLAGSPTVQKAAALSPDPTQKRLLTPADMIGRSAWELTLKRNEIYARHGRQFTEPKLQHHFESQSWYRPRYAPGKFSVSLLSKTEQQNAIFIRDYQRTHGLNVDL